MNARFLRGFSTLFSILLVASLTAGHAFAQPASDPGKDNRPQRPRAFPRGARPGGFPPGGFMGGAFWPFLERVLTDAQRTSLRAALDEQREPMRELGEKMRVARRELMQTSLLDTFEEAAVRSKAKEVARLDAELTVLRAKAFSQMKPALSSEQIEILRSPPPFDGGRNRGDPPGRRFNGPRDENDLPVRPQPEN